MSGFSATTTKKDAVLLIAAIHAFLVSFPSLIFSLTQRIDQDPSLKLLFTPEAARQLKSGLTKDFYEITLLTIAVLSYGYYRAYVDGAHRHPWIVAAAGGTKVGGAVLLATWYLQGHVAVLFLLLDAVMELLLGLYIVNWWRQTGFKIAVPANQGDEQATNPITAPRNWVFGLSAAHLFLVTFPSFLLSITGNTEKDFGLSLMADKSGVSLLSSSGLARDSRQFFFYLLVWFSLGYGRIYLDGAARQPLMVLMGGLLKLGAAAMLLSWQWKGDVLPGIALVYAPELAFGFYFLKVWWFDLGGAYYYEPRTKGKKQ